MIATIMFTVSMSTESPPEIIMVIIIVAVVVIFIVLLIAFFVGTYYIEFKTWLVVV